MRVSHTGHCESIYDENQHSDSQGTSTAPPQEPQADITTQSATEQTVPDPVMIHDQGVKRSRQRDEPDDHEHLQLSKVRRTDEEDDELLSVMRNEGVLLELGGPVRTTSEKVSSIKTIRSSKSCLAFGLYHVESWGRRDGNVSHECRLNVLISQTSDGAGQQVLCHGHEI